MVTGSNSATALATAAWVFKVLGKSAPHKSSRQGQAIQVRSWGCHSAGIQKPASLGLVISLS